MNNPTDPSSSPKRQSRFRFAVGLALVVLLLFCLAIRFVPSARVQLSRLFGGDVHTVSSRLAEFRSTRPELDALAQSAGGGIDILVLKRERRVEVHAPGWKAPITMPMTATSGNPGPKLREGDRQIPEGIYQAAGLNPNSAFHVSLHVGYPNEEDRLHAKEDGRTRLGGDIFLHGGAASVGCIAVGDENAELVFFLAAQCGVKSIVIAPYDMRLGRDVSYEASIEAPSWYPRLLDEIEVEMQSESSHETAF